jgi:hypothetical protein
MAAFQTSSTFPGPDNKEIVLQLSLVEDQNDDEITVKATYDDKDIGSVKWRVNYKSKTLTLDLSALMSSGQAICLAACLGGSIGATLADCLARARTASAVRECFKKHAPGALVSSISCVFGCLAV